MFAVSLAYFFYTYLVGFDQPARADSVTSALLINGGMFGLFALHHSVFARQAVKDVIARVLPPGIERTLYVWVASGLFMGVCRHWQPLAGVVYWHTGTAALLHAGVQLAGLIVMAVAVVRLDALELAGIHWGSAEPDGFTRRSIYGLVRHPIYSGWLLFVFGTPHLNATRLGFAVVSLAYVLVAMPWEERTLERIRGHKYRSYLERVRWRLVPGIY